MDQKTWVTDKFYLQFPSYSEQNRKSELLAKARQQDYQKYLRQLTFIEEPLSSRALKRGAYNEQHYKRPKFPDLDLKFLDSGRSSVRSSNKDIVEKSDRDIESCTTTSKSVCDIQHMNLPNILNEEVIKERNRRMNEENNFKKIQYQRDLLEQIEIKKRENERRKAMEKVEEERVTRRMEEQLRALRLEKEMEEQRDKQQREKRCISVEPEKPRNYQPATKQETPTITYHNSLERRKAYSENDKENIISKKSDKDLYKYFSNSAKDANDLKNLRYRAVINDDNVIHSDFSSSTLPEPPQYFSPSDYCAGCQMDLMKKNLCGFCKQQQYLSQNQSGSTSDRNLFMCTFCHADPICRSCQKKICQKCKKPIRKDKQLNIPKNPIELPRAAIRKSDTELSQFSSSPRAIKNASDISGSRSPSKMLETEVFRQASRASFNYDINDAKDDQSVRSNEINEPKPYSMNVDKSSIFHPDNELPNKRFSININTNGEVLIEQNGLDRLEELKRITDEKVAKFINTYGKLPQSKQVKKRSIDIDEFPLTQFVEPMKPPIDIDTRRESVEANSPAFKMLETKWDIPVVQKNTVKEGGDNICVLTQIGAFKKQLQLDQFELDVFDK